jgi:hypothetical protein
VNLKLVNLLFRKLECNKQPESAQSEEMFHVKDSRLPYVLFILEFLPSVMPQFKSTEACSKFESND